MNLRHERVKHKNLMLIASKVLHVYDVFSQVILFKFSLNYAGLKIATAWLTLDAARLTNHRIKRLSGLPG